TSLQHRIDALLKGLFDLIDQEIHIPVVTPFYENVVMKGTDEKLTLLGLTTLIGAMVGTFTYKLEAGVDKPLFTKQEADEFCAIPADQYTWLVNPFRSHGQVSATPPILGPRYSMLIAALAAGGTFFAGIAGTASDVEYICDPIILNAQPEWQKKVAEQLRYKGNSNIIWLRSVGACLTAGQVILLASEVLAVIDAFKHGDTPDEKVYELANIAMSVVTTISSTVATYYNKWAEGGDLITAIVSGGVSVILGIAIWAESSEPRAYPTVCGGVNALVSGAGSLLQATKYGIAQNPPIKPEYLAILSAVLLGVGDGVGYGGALATEIALVAYYGNHNQVEKHPGHSGPAVFNP
ncbi:MAG TPA: hypothetical protein VGP24_07055, partial [Glaciihabitans sp.]|nr:hypothetical protein [Glaciihabitans sp.]